MTTALTRHSADDLDTMTLGQVLSKSGYFQDAREASQAIVKVLAGRELGFPAIASMTGVHIIKGRVSLSANLIAAAIKRSKPAYNYRVTELTDRVCTIVFYEDGEECGVSTFTAEDARKAETQNMHKFPRNMLFARALSNGAKWYCAAIFGGPVYTPEELGAAVDGETGEPIDVTPPPLQIVEQPAPVQTINANLRRKPDVTPEQAEAKFWERFGPVLGGTNLANVEMLLHEPVGEIATVDAWRSLWREVEAALAAQEADRVEQELAAA